MTDPAPTEERCPECGHLWKLHSRLMESCSALVAKREPRRPGEVPPSRPCGCEATPPSPGEPDPGDELPTFADLPDRRLPYPDEPTDLLAASPGGLPGGPEPSDGPTNEALAAQMERQADRAERDGMDATARGYRLIAARLRAAPPSPGPDGRRLAELRALSEAATAGRWEAKATLHGDPYVTVEGRFQMAAITNSFTGPVANPPALVNVATAPADYGKANSEWIAAACNFVRDLLAAAAPGVPGAGEREVPKGRRDTFVKLGNVKRVLGAAAGQEALDRLAGAGEQEETHGD